MRNLKKTLLLIAGFYFLLLHISAQDQQLNAAVTQLDKAKTAKELQGLSAQFIGLTGSQPNNWLPYYYAALCNAKIGFLYQDDGERIEPFANDGESYAKKAQELLKAASGSNKDKAELLTVMSMVYRTRVFINPMTYGPQYGPTAQQYLDQALKLDPDNPRALYLEGWTKYATPKMWGGDKDKAKTLLQAASEKLQQQDASGVQPHWGKTEIDAMLAKFK
jgi:hypothetical protein